MENKEKIGDYLFDCLTQKQKKILNKIFDDDSMGFNNPPVIADKKIKDGRSFKDAVIIEIKLIPGSAG